MTHQFIKNKNALIFGAKGAIGQKVVAEFIVAGANVYQSDISVSGEVEENKYGSVRKLNVLNEIDVEKYFNWFKENNIPIDIVVNLTSSDPAEYSHGKPAIEVTSDQFIIPLKNNTASQFITAKYAYGIMASQHSGVIIFVTSSLAKVGSPWSAALTASHAATEGLVRSLAHEWGPAGIRVLGVRSEAMPDSKAIEYTFKTMGANIGLSGEEMQEYVSQKTALKRLPSTTDTAKLIVIAGSDIMNNMSGTMLNQSGGHILE